MLTDLPGRLNNIRLPHTKALTPLFECVINSMQAIDDAGVSPGRIDIHIKRDPRQSSFALGQQLPPISGFLVADNGIGFNDENFKSFETSDSTYKRQIGGKGIGRLLWLKAFEEVRVRSVFRDFADVRSRTFYFRKSLAGIERHELVKVDKKTPIQTIVELLQIAEPYRIECPNSAEVITARLIEHLLVRFLNPKGPEIWLHDDIAEKHVDVKTTYRQEFATGIAKEQINVGQFQFTCHMARMYSAEETRHRFFLCAHDRDVNAEKLQPHIPDLTKKLTDDRGAFLLLAYVTGEYLDSRVNQERTAIAFGDDDSSLTDDITRPALVNKVVEAVKNHVDPFLKSIREEKRNQIEDYIVVDAPEYRPLLKPKYAEVLGDIPPHLSSEKLDAELHKRAFRIEQEVREKAVEIRKAKVETPEQLTELKERYAALIEEENELGKAKLAKYVIHRKTILELFERNLALQPDNSYALETSIHEIICPLRITSDDVPFEKLNLWIIDERLAFHHYLASDKALDTLEAVQAGGEKRPDLVIFNRPIAFVDSAAPFQSIVIVEFKRPMREEYRKKDPVTQVYEYVEEITAGKAKDRTGRPIPVKGIPFYAYVVCDITADVKAACRKAQLLETPDGMGYFGFNSHFNTYIEVMAFTKILENSKRRNRVFFEQLGLPAS